MLFVCRQFCDEIGFQGKGEPFGYLDLFFMRTACNGRYNDSDVKDFTVCMLFIDCNSYVFEAVSFNYRD